MCVCVVSPISCVTRVKGFVWPAICFGHSASVYMCVCVCALLCVFMWFEGERYLFVCSSDRCPFWPEHFSQLLQRIIACPKTVSFPRKSNKSQVLIIARIREQKRKEKGKRKKGDKASQGRRAAPNILLVYEHKSLIQSPPSLTR